MLFDWKEKPQMLQNTAAQTSYCRLIKKNEENVSPFTVNIKNLYIIRI